MILALSEEKMGVPIPSSIRRTFEAAAVSAKEPLVQIYRTDVLEEMIYDIAYPIMSMREERGREETGLAPEPGKYLEKIGTVRVGISLAETNKAIQELIGLAHRVTALVIVFGILFTALLVGIITTPLRELLRGMVKVSEGDLTPVKVKSSDEIGDLASAFNQMVMELLRLRQQSEGARKTLEFRMTERTREAEELKSYSGNVIATMAEGLVAVDVEGNITMVNRALEELSGFGRSELLGQRFVSRLFPGQDREKAIEAIEKARGEGVLRDADLNLNRFDGKEVAVSLSAATLRDSEGKPQGMVIILHDMSKEREAERLKSEFISTISHELRTPLTSIEGFVSLILGGKVGEVPAKQQDFLKIVQTQSKHLGDLIKNLLDFSRFVTGKMEIEKHPVSVESIINEVVSAMSAQFQTKGFKVDIEVEKGMPQVPGDGEKLGMVLSNILGNALKFNEGQGKVKVIAKRQNDNIFVSVTDNGIGVAKENIGKLFRRFYQVDSTLTRKIGGAGIGLAISREIVLAHGGKIRAESQGLGKGSAFSFTIPIR
jgi:PAS domain S-box-containing protein